MKLYELYGTISKATEIGIIVNDEFKRIFDEEECPAAYMYMKVDMVSPVGFNKMNIYLKDTDKVKWLDDDAAESRCLGDIVD